jgi:hypothetical protein
MAYHPSPDHWEARPAPELDLAPDRRAAMPLAPESSVAARGARSNVIWSDPEHDLVVVVHWIDRSHVEGFFHLDLDSVEG